MTNQIEIETAEQATLTRAEGSLLTLLGIGIASHLGALSRGREVDQAQLTDMRTKAERVLCGTIIGLRGEGPMPTPGELGQVMAEVAEACFQAVVGPLSAAPEERPS